MIYLKLFLSFIHIGLFSIGGGYAAMPLIQNQVIYINHWLTLTEFTDLITIAEMTPGPIAINSATFVGLQIAGFGGALIATLGCVLPSCFIVSLLAYFYYKYQNFTIIQHILGALRPAVIALIASAGLTILILAFWSETGISSNLNNINFISVGIFIIALFLLRKYKLNPIFIMILSGLLGLLTSIIA
jgi:chromate transporter